MAWDLQERRPVAGVGTGAGLTEPCESSSVSRTAARAWRRFPREALRRRANSRRIGGKKDRSPTHGYEATRKAAMAAFVKNRAGKGS
jgi:hypothetical protein